MGRPKGSKNKPKSTGSIDGNTVSTTPSPIYPATSGIPSIPVATTGVPPIPGAAVVGQVPPIPGQEPRSVSATRTPGLSNSKADAGKTNIGDRIMAEAFKPGAHCVKCGRSLEASQRAFTVRGSGMACSEACKNEYNGDTPVKKLKETTDQFEAGPIALGSPKLAYVIDKLRPISPDDENKLPPDPDPNIKPFSISPALSSFPDFASSVREYTYVAAVAKKADDRRKELGGQLLLQLQFDAGLNGIQLKPSVSADEATKLQAPTGRLHAVYCAGKIVGVMVKRFTPVDIGKFKTLLVEAGIDTATIAQAEAEATQIEFSEFVQLFDGGK